MNIECVAMLPGGARFVSGSGNVTAKLWTLDGALERIFAVGNVVVCVAALPDGVHFVVGLGKSEVRLYHVDGTLVHTFKGHGGEVNALAATRDGQHIISGADDGLVKVWSVASKSLVSTCGVENNEKGTEIWVRSVAAMPDGQRILSGGNNETVRVHLLDGTHENTFPQAGWVSSLVALPDNQHALAVAGGVKLFNVNDGAVLRTFNDEAGVYCLALLTDGLRFVCGTYDGTAHIVYHGLAPH
jgi:WD40 repeat protein